MSTLSVSNITTPTNTTPLVLSSANSQAAFVRVEAANNDIVFNGTTKFLGTLSASYLQSNSINVAFDVANASFNTANTVSATVVSASFNTANAAYGLANTSSASLGSNWAVTNTVYGVANAAFNSANNVAPQVTPAFNTANAAYSYANTVYSTLNASIGSNWTVTNTIYGIANTALPNTSSSTLAGTLTVSTSGIPQVINSTNSNTYKVALRDNGTTVGFFGGSSSTPFIVANSAVNTLFSVDNVGNFAATGNISSVGIISGNFPSLFQSSTQATTSTDRSLGFSTSWTNHLSVTFTTTRAGPIYAGTVLAMSYESAAVQGEAQFVLSGAASMTSQFMAVAQQSDANKARGAHSMTWMFGNCPAGSYTLTLQVRNNGSGSTWILNNYLGFDTLYTSYM